MDDSGPRSLFLVVMREDIRYPWFCSILQFNSNDNNNHKQPKWPKNLGRRMKGLADRIKQSRPSSSGKHLLQKEYIAHFRLLQRPASIGWEFSPVTSTQELCMVPYVIPDGYNRMNDGVPSVHGFTFNFATKTCTRIDPAISSRPDRCVVNLGGYMYFLPQPNALLDIPKQYFERYNLVGNFWETLQSFPMPPDGIESLRRIRATAVWGDTILINMGDPDIWAYNVTKNKWYPVTVKVEDSLCYSFVDEAVVLGNTIYALKDMSAESVLALSIVREDISGGDFVYTCSLLSDISLPDFNLISVNDVAYISSHLVPFGKDNFCLVQSCMREGYPDFQPIQLTYMKPDGKNSLIITDNKVHRLRIEGGQQFMVSRCFSLPDSKTPPAFKHGNIFLDIDPFRVGFDIKQIYNTDFNFETEELVMPYVPTPPLLIDPVTRLQEEDVPEKSSASLVDESNAFSKVSTSAVTRNLSHGSATHGDYPASPEFETVGQALEYYTLGMSIGEATKTKRMLLDRWRKEHCQKVASFLAKNPSFPEA